MRKTLTLQRLTTTAAFAATLAAATAFSPSVSFNGVGSATLFAADAPDAAASPNYVDDYAAFADRFVLPPFPEVASADVQKGWYANKKKCGRDLIALLLAKYPTFDVAPSDANEEAWTDFASNALLLRGKIGGAIFDENHGGTLIKKYYSTDYEQDKIAALYQTALNVKTELETSLDAISQDAVWKAARRAELDLFLADFSRWMKPFCRASFAKLPTTQEFKKNPDLFLTAADLLEFAVDYIPNDDAFAATVDGILALLDEPKAIEIRVFHGRYEGKSYVLTPRETIFQRYRDRIEAVAARRLQTVLTPKLIDAIVFNERQTELFEHGSLPSWNAQNPAQTDRFYVVFPKTGPAPNRPLYVVLHSAGHSAKTALDCTPTVGNHDIYRAPDDFYALYVDCFDNKATDWWWGGRRADETEINADNAARSTAEFQPVEKRVRDVIAWAVETYQIDANRIYLCGNSMGGSGTLGIGLRGGDVFAAIKANVPAGVWHAFDRLRLGDENATAADFPEPPICLDYSAPNDSWSQGHEALFAGVEARKYSYIAYWGNFGHENNDAKVAKINDLFKTFDWLSIRKNEAYPVFTAASTDSAIPWPERAADAPAGQRGAFFRWQNRVDEAERFEIELRLATADELRSEIFEIPTSSTADVTLRRLQNFRVAPGESVRWTFGEQSGTVQADATGAVTIPQLTTTDKPTALILEK